MTDVKIGIIGGSGVYEIEGAKYIKEIKLKTPFGEPSEAVKIIEINGIPVAFLPRHGIGHRYSPAELNYRANIYLLKKIGIEKILAISACGSLKEEIKPRDFVIPDQIYDRTKSRASTFFDRGVVVHVGFAEPYCNELRKVLYETTKSLDLPVHNGGTYVCIDGPQFSSKAESKVYRSLGFSIIGMTNLPEAKLAREAEMCYASIGLATDYDVWKEGEEVSVEKVIENMHILTANVKKVIKSVVTKIKDSTNCSCKDALKYAIITDPKVISSTTKKRLEPLISKYIK
ncbi:MAG: methylthioadenosine phosphorylase [Elusimicrobia bacterium RIFOXYC2_FULL_34_12]|nr:MAG: methylthioadenosine phosphorylase [Elusimicrobia bacterium RIFOXYC2_FULL_34_12]OGS37998.1 MAG: methylthioadenosine phosphorylase [Elusimicrobia bacterium RIFOXYD2_FULL_34_30]